MNARRFTPRTVTFDCWQTLIYDRGARGLSRSRIDQMVAITQIDPQRIGAAFAAAWVEHQRAWHRRVAFNGPEITQHVLQALGVELSPEREAELVSALEDDLLTHDIGVIDGARELLSELRSAGVRVALICDTGFSPGRVVRQLLARVGLLEHLEVQIFSDEIRVPKPHPRAFTAALEGLGASASSAVHVGDLRRSDIAGARAAGMGTVRFRGRNDDSDEAAGPNAGVVDCATAGCRPICDRPEADFVANSYADLSHHLRVRNW
jgi:putative hydrolase of the HAD superfamily